MNSDTKTSRTKDDNSRQQQDTGFRNPANQQQENPAMTGEEYALAYDNGYKLTVRFLISRGLSGDTAEEAAQAAWGKGWAHRHRLRNRNMVVSWVNTIALNLFRNSLRRRESLEAVPDVPTAPTVSAQAIDIHRTLAKCKDRDRALLEQHYLEGYTSDELAEKTGSTAVAIRVRLLRARRRLRRVLRPRKGVKTQLRGRKPGIGELAMQPS